MHSINIRVELINCLKSSQKNKIKKYYFFHQKIGISIIKNGREQLIIITMS